MDNKSRKKKKTSWSKKRQKMQIECRIQKKNSKLLRQYSNSRTGWLLTLHRSSLKKHASRYQLKKADTPRDSTRTKMNLRQLSTKNFFFTQITNTTQLQTIPSHSWSHTTTPASKEWEKTYVRKRPPHQLNGVNWNSFPQRKIKKN